MERITRAVNSIKARITFFYAIMMIVIVALSCVAIFLSAWFGVIRTSKTMLAQEVADGLTNIGEKSGVVEIKKDFNTAVHGVTLVVYSDNGNRIKGSVPRGFHEKTPLRKGFYQRLEDGLDDWMVYDDNKVMKDGSKIWIRGIYAMDNRMQSSKILLIASSILLPFIVLLALIAGYLITKRAFRPVAEMTETANRIEAGDLTERLPVGRYRDEIHDLAETLNRMLTRLERAFENEKQFSGDVSHELKTPVAVIMAECEYALANSKTDEDYRRSIESIHKQCRRMLAMVNQLLQLSRTQNTESLIDKESFDLSMLCESVMEEQELTLAKRAAGEGRRLRLEREIEPGVKFRGDETMLMRVLINLLNNAVRYSRKDAEDPFVRLKLRKVTSAEGAAIELTVEDNGIGMSRSDCEKIFNKFYKADSARAEESGFGLGLSMVKWIVEAHGGTIRVESEPMRGSCFTVMLPAE